MTIQVILGSSYESKFIKFNCLEISRQIGYQQLVGRNLDAIATIYGLKAEYDQALKLYNESLEITRQLGEQYMIGLSLNNIALVLLKKEEYEESLCHVLQASIKY